jgi:hypothetical protein
MRYYIKEAIDKLSLKELRESVLVEMRTKPLLTDEETEYLLKAYDDKIAELYW